MMLEFLEIDKRQRNKINIWADSIIDKNKLLIASQKGSYLLWSNRFYYQPGKDTWADESWWIEMAQQLFVEHKDDFDGMGTRVIPALEILVHHFPKDYVNHARDKIDRWFNQSYHDPEYWWDLIVSVYPEHPATELLFEQQDNSWETGIALKLGDLKTEIAIKEYILSELEEDANIFCLCDMLNGLDKDMFNRMFSESESNTIQSLLLEVAKKELALDLEKYFGSECLDRHFILPTATIMGWQEILDALANNTYYLEGLLHVFKVSSPDELLWWSLTKNHKLTESLVYQLYPDINSLYKVHHLDFPSHSFALAIAWKRSQSQIGLL